jgi:hypothetical protein
MPAEAAVWYFARTVFPWAAGRKADSMERRYSIVEAQEYPPDKPRASASGWLDATIA